MLRSFALRAVAVLVAAAGCTRGCGGGRAAMPPEKVVESYLNVALNMKQVSEREDLARFTTGRLKEAIAAASEETIVNAYIKRHYDLESFAIIERRDRTPRETEITFRLKYHDLGTADKRPTNIAEMPYVQTENTVALIKEKGVWFIRDVVGAKTSIDFPVSSESVIRAKAGTVTEHESNEGSSEPEPPVEP